MAVPVRPDPPSGDGEPAPGAAGVPSDPSALDGLPPYDPEDLPPVPRTGHGTGGEGSGSPPAPGDDPDALGSDAYDDTPAFPYGDGRGVPLDLTGDRDRPGEGWSPSALLGEGDHEGERDGVEWLLGLAAVLVLLGLVVLVLSSRGP